MKILVYLKLALAISLILTGCQPTDNKNVANANTSATTVSSDSSNVSNSNQQRNASNNENSSFAPEIV